MHARAHGLRRATAVVAAGTAALAVLPGVASAAARDTTPSVPFAAGPGDGGAGIAREQLRRRVGTVTAGTCAESSTFRRGGCYRYRITEQDAAGNARVTVGPGHLVINTAPTALPGTTATPAGSPGRVTLAGTDADGDTLSYAVVGAPRHGRISGTAPALTYTPDPGFSGADALSFTVSDGLATSAAATVSLTVTPVNNAPRATAQTVTTQQGVRKAVTLSGTDVDGDALTYRVVNGPANGTLSGTAPTLTYVPRAGFSGNDSFTFVASDGTLTSAAATVAVTVEPAPVAPGTGPLSFSASGMHGAGFQNVVAVDPRGTGLVLSGADVSGIHRSTDWGKTFTTSNVGLTSMPQLHVAALQFSPTVAGKVYAAVGHRGGGGGLMVSTDEGRSWTLRSREPQFSGSNNRVAELPTTHPRSTGNLLAFDPSRGLIYAASFSQGVMRSADDGRTWTSLGLAGKYLRSIAIDPAKPDVVYASAYGDGVYRTTAASGAGSFTKLTSSPTHAEELLVLGDRVYAAAGKAGVQVSADGGATWRQLGAGVVRTDGPTWLSIDGYRDGSTGKHVLVVGADKPTRQANGMTDSLLRSLDGGSTWTSLTADPARIHDEVGGPGGEPWWLLKRQASMALGRVSYTASHIVVSDAAPARILVAGRSGVWGTSDAGANWYPMVRGLQVTINKQVTADPKAPGRVYVANTDWVTLYSTDGGKTVAQNRPPTGNTGFALALDTATTPSTVYAAVGDRDVNSHGEIYANTDPAAGGAWVGQGLGAATGGKRPVAVAVRRVGGSPVLLAAVEGGGIWRKEGGAWTRASAAAMSSATGKFASLSWVPGSSLVFLHDPRSGVWRSADAGRTWTQIWTKTSPNTNTTTSIAADPTAPGTVYVSMAGDGVYRLDGATSGTVGAGISPVKLAGVARPGPIAVGSDGRLHMAEFASGSTAGSLRVSADDGRTWTVMSDAAYRGAAGFPFSLAVGPRGEAYLSLNGNGVLRGVPQA